MQTIWFCIHSNFEDGGTSTSTYGLTASVFKGLHVGDFDWLWKEMKESDDVIGRLTWNMSLCSRQPSYPGMVPSWKSNWWMFFRLWTVFLSSGLFVGPPPTGHRSVGTGCHSNWSSSHTRAIQHCYVTTNAVQNCFSTNRAHSIGVLYFIWASYWCTPYQYIDAWLL